MEERTRGDTVLMLSVPVTRHISISPLAFIISVLTGDSMGRVHSGVGYLTGRKFAVDSSTKRILQSDWPEIQTDPKG